MALGRPFWTFWCAALLANLGDGIRLAAFPLLAASLSDSPALVAVVMASTTLPWLFTGLWAGSLADRHAARVLMTLADVGRIVVLAGLIAFLVSGRATIAGVAVAAFLLGVGETLRDTATQTLIPRLVPSTLLERANGRLTAGELIGNEFVGPLLGGVLFGAGAALPFLVNGATSALAVLLILALPAAVLSAVSAGPERGQAEGRGIRAGLSWLRRQPLLRVLVITVAFVALADSAWFSIFVLYGKQELGLQSAGFGALLALGAFGGLAGALAADVVISGTRHRSAIAWSAAIAALAPCALLVFPDLWVARFVVVATSAAFGLLNVAAVSLRHRVVPLNLLGRVSATWRVGVYAASAGGALVGGALASFHGLEAPFVLSGVIGIGMPAVWWLTSRTAADIAAG